MGLLNFEECRIEARPFGHLMTKPHFYFLLFLSGIGQLLFAAGAARAATATVTAGRAVTLSVTASGSAPFTYQWRKNGVNISGATAASYAITSFQAGNAGVYSAVVANSSGSTTSDQGTLVFGAIPAFTTQPAGAVVTVGNAVTLTAVASGTPAPTYQWRKNGVNISGATAGSYTMSSVTTASAGTYSVVATNSVGSATSTGAILTVNLAALAPVITTQPVSRTVATGGSVTFTAAASGTPAPTFQWRRNGVNIPGATTAAFTLNSVTTGNAGTYTVVATNLVGSATSNGAVLTVTSAPGITTQPVSQTVTAGNGVTFTVAASGTPTLTISGSGSDIWGAADAFRFHSQTLTGDGAITVRVAAAGNTHPWAKIGVMFREDLSAGSREVMAFVTPGNHSSLQYRLAPGAASAQAADTFGAMPVWLMLVRSGNTFGGYKSANGVDWTLLGSVTCVMPATIRVGLAVSSHDAARTTTAIFDNVEVDSVALPPAGPPVAPAGLTASGSTTTSVNLSWSDVSADETGFVVERALGSAGAFAEVGSTPANASSYVDSGVSAATSYLYRVRARRDAVYSAYSNTATATTPSAPPPPPAWARTGLGAGSGSFAEVGSMMSLTAKGLDLWGQYDDGLFVNRAWTGDGEIVARVDSLTNTHPFAKAGVMFRESLASTAPNVFVGLTPASGATFQVRSTSSGLTSEAQAGLSARPPSWVRLTRVGNTFTAAVSANGTTWTTLGSQTLALPATIYVGLAVTSRSSTVATDAMFWNVQVR